MSGTRRRIERLEDTQLPRCKFCDGLGFKEDAPTAAELHVMLADNAAHRPLTRRAPKPIVPCSLCAGTGVDNPGAVERLATDLRALLAAICGDEPNDETEHP